MSRYFKRDGTPINMIEWAKLFDDIEYKIVKRDDLKCGCHVSTVWLGLDHSFSDVAPLIFETMVFPEESQARYSTEKKAEAGHKVTVINHSCDKKIKV